MGGNKSERRDEHGLPPVNKGWGVRGVKWQTLCILSLEPVNTESWDKSLKSGSLLATVASALG